MTTRGEIGDMMTQSTRPSRFRWRRVKALFRLLKWIFWTERKKRYLGKGERWEPLKGFMYEGLLNFAFIMAFFFITGNIEYFFPFWVPEFPAKAELMEVSGSLDFHHFSARGRTNYFTITQDRYGINKTILKCQSGFGGSSVISCSDNKIPKDLDWDKTIALYHPQWGLIELIVDGYTVPNCNYEHHKSFMKWAGKTSAYLVLASFLVILFYLVRDCQLYRRRRARNVSALTGRKTSRKGSCD